MKYIRMGDTVRTVGQLEGEQNPFTDEQPRFTASRQRKPLLEGRQ